MTHVKQASFYGFYKMLQIQRLAFEIVEYKVCQESKMNV